MSWTHYIKHTLITMLASALTLYGFIVLVDPYDTNWLSPPADREPMGLNQRYAYPGLARTPELDSVILGTSSSRLLRPEKLNRPLGANFVNLGMNAATGTEQARLLSIYLDHHQRPRYALFGIDSPWCQSELMPEVHPELHYPEWMYDDNRWNDLLYQFDADTLAQAWKQFRNLIGVREWRWGRDGYRNFLPPDSQYSIERARTKIYEESLSGLPTIAPTSAPSGTIAAETRAAWHYPNLALLDQMLGALPDPTVKILLFPPYHRVHMPAPGTEREAKLDECKRRIAQIAGKRPNSLVMDFMRISPVTVADENYWDGLHYRLAVADQIIAGIVGTLGGSEIKAPNFQVLHRDPIAETGLRSSVPPQYRQQ